VLSLCGLGFIDEMEVEAVQVADAQMRPDPMMAGGSAAPNWKNRAEMRDAIVAAAEGIEPEEFTRILLENGVEDIPSIKDRTVGLNIWTAARLLTGRSDE